MIAARVLLRDDARIGQHGGMRLRGADVLRGQTLVEADGGVYLLHDLGGRGREAAAPHVVGRLVGHGVGCSVRGRSNVSAKEANADDQPPVAKQNRSMAWYAWLAALSALAASRRYTSRWAGLTIKRSRRRRPRRRRQTVKPSAQPARHRRHDDLRLQAAARGAARHPISLTAAAPRSASPSFRGKVVLLTCGPPGARPAARRCRRSTGCRRRSAPTSSRSWRWRSTSRGVDGAKKFLADIKVEKLELYADPTAKEGTRLKVIGMPTTILIDARRPRDRPPASARPHWDSPEAKRLIEAQLQN